MIEDEEEATTTTIATATIAVMDLQTITVVAVIAMAADTGETDDAIVLASGTKVQTITRDLRRHDEGFIRRGMDSRAHR